MSHICDVPGLSVGHAQDGERRTGTSVVVAAAGAVAGVSVLGGAPGTRETDALHPSGLGPPVDAVVLSGGSAFGLAAADGAQRVLHQAGRGFPVGEHRVPIVPAAIIFDLSGPPPDYAALGAAACRAALASADRSEGSVGAGTGARCAGVKGGIGSALESAAGGVVGALVVANAVGSPIAANGPWLRAAPFEVDGEFAAVGPAPADADWRTLHHKLASTARENTTVAVVATDLSLDRGGAHRLALAGQDGFAAALYPSHTLYDGDTVFALATQRAPAPRTPDAWVALSAAATRAVARALARAVLAATPVPGIETPTLRERFGLSPA